MSLSESERQVLARFRDRLQTQLPEEQIEVILFGSKARGEGREDSDLDVLVIVLGEDWRLCDKVYDIATDLLLETGVCISLRLSARISIDSSKTRRLLLSRTLSVTRW